MEAMEIMNNDEVIETTGEKISSGKSFKIIAGISLAILVGGLTYKYVAEPIVAKIKAKHEQKKIKVIKLNRLEDDFDESEEN